MIRLNLASVLAVAIAGGVQPDIARFRLVLTHANSSER
jgi:hypothetical protein